MSTADTDLLLSRQFAHDLRSPMAALLVLVTGLRQEVEGGGSPDPGALVMMEEALLAMDAMLMGLVAIGGGDGLGSAKGHSEPFSFDEVLGRVGALLAPWNQVRGTPFTWEVEGDDRWEGHAEPLAHLLFLLLVSLLQAIPEDSGPLRVRVFQPSDRSHRPPGVLIQVQGPGRFPDADVLAKLQGVVEGSTPRTHACQAHLPFEGALWLARALGARLETGSLEDQRRALVFSLPLHPAPSRP